MNDLNGPALFRFPKQRWSKKRAKVGKVRFFTPPVWLFPAKYWYSIICVFELAPGHLHERLSQLSDVQVAGIFVFNNYDIQSGILQKIIEWGIGQKMIVAIGEKNQRNIPGHKPPNQQAAPLYHLNPGGIRKHNLLIINSLFCKKWGILILVKNMVWLLF